MVCARAPCALRRRKRRPAVAGRPQNYCWRVLGRRACFNVPCRKNCARTELASSKTLAYTLSHTSRGTGFVARTEKQGERPPLYCHSLELLAGVNDALPIPHTTAALEHHCICPSCRAREATSRPSRAPEGRRSDGQEKRHSSGAPHLAPNRGRRRRPRPRGYINAPSTRAREREHAPVGLRPQIYVSQVQPRLAEQGIETPALPYSNTNYLKK